MERQHKVASQTRKNGRYGIVYGIVSMVVVLLLGTPMLGFLVEAQGSEGRIASRDTVHLGTILTDSSGRTLYVFSGDRPNNSACRGNCARDWPPMLLERGNSVAARHLLGRFGLLTREDGGRQVTYDDQPLYYSRHDRAPGDTSGHGVDGVWHVANVAPTVRVQNHPELGDILVGPNGMTLYTSTRDVGDGTSRCTEGCLAHWPPLTIGRQPSSPPGLTGQLRTLVRNWLDDEAIPELRGAVHVTYQGKPLHYWSRDEAPGDVTGHGVGDVWYVARP